jgi:hypothetical protein
LTTFIERLVCNCKTFKSRKLCAPRRTAVDPLPGWDGGGVRAEARTFNASGPEGRMVAAAVFRDLKVPAPSGCRPHACDTLAARTPPVQAVWGPALHDLKVPAPSIVCGAWMRHPARHGAESPTLQGQPQEGPRPFCSCLSLKMAKAAGADSSGGPNGGGRAGYGMRTTVRIWNVEMFART